MTKAKNTTSALAITGVTFMLLGAAASTVNPLLTIPFAFLAATVGAVAAVKVA